MPDFLRSPSTAEKADHFLLGRVDEKKVKAAVKLISPKPEEAELCARRVRWALVRWQVAEEGAPLRQRQLKLKDRREAARSFRSALLRAKQAAAAIPEGDDIFLNINREDWTLKVEPLLDFYIKRCDDVAESDIGKEVPRRTAAEEEWAARKACEILFEFHSRRFSASPQGPFVRLAKLLCAKENPKNMVRHCQDANKHYFASDQTKA